MTTEERNQLITGHFPCFRSIASFQARNRPELRIDIDDFAQDLALSAIKWFGRFNPDRGAFDKWLQYVALSVLYNQRVVRQAARRIPANKLTSFVDVSPQAIERVIAETGGDPLATLIDAEDAQANNAKVAKLTPIIDKLREPYRSNLIRRYGLDGRGGCEIRDIDSSLAPATMAKRLRRGLDSVRHIVGGGAPQGMAAIDGRGRRLNRRSIAA